MIRYLSIPVSFILFKNRILLFSRTTVFKNSFMKELTNAYNSFTPSAIVNVWQKIHHCGHLGAGKKSTICTYPPRSTQVWSRFAKIYFRPDVKIMHSQTWQMDIFCVLQFYRKSSQSPTFFICAPGRNLRKYPTELCRNKILKNAYKINKGGSSNNDFYLIYDIYIWSNVIYTYVQFYSILYGTIAWSLNLLIDIRDNFFRW